MPASIRQRYGSAAQNPDPYRNFMGPQHCLSYRDFGSDAAAAGMKRALAAGARRPLLVAQGSLPAGTRAEVS
jgi:hypothetical protein